MRQFMDSALNAKVSFLESVTAAGKPINTGTFLQIVTSEKLLKKYGQLLQKLRGCQDKTERDNLKKTLPAFTPSGKFSERNAAGLLEHSGLLTFDVDAKGNTWLNSETAPALRDQIANLPEVAYVALSASGAGVWGVVVIENPEQHKEHFKALQTDFAAFGIVIDSACSDVCRARFWSYDPDAKFNHSPTIYRKLPAPPQAAPYMPAARRYDQPRPDDLAALAADHLIKSKAVVAFGYEDYFRIVTACKNAFGDNGDATAWAILENSPNFIQSNFRKHFAEKWRAAGNKVTGGTLVHIAKEHGFLYSAAPKATDSATRPQAAPQQPTTPQPEQSKVLPPGYRFERYTDKAGNQVETLINADGYPAAWDVEPMAKAALTRAIQNNPVLTSAICRLDLTFDGVSALDDAEAQAWQAKQERRRAWYPAPTDRTQQPAPAGA